MADCSELPSADGDLINSNAKVTTTSKGDLGTDSGSFFNCWAKICGVKVENPTYIIPIHPPSVNLNVGWSCTAGRLWTGDDTDTSLLASEQGILVEVRNKSSLIFTDDNNSSRGWSEEVSAPKILLPLQTAKQIGFTRLSSLGPVTQCRLSSTFVLEKVSSVSECEDATATVLHFRNQIFTIKHAAAPTNTSTDAFSNWQLERELMVSPMRKWPKIFKSSLCNLLTVRVMLVLLITRFALGWLDEQYSIFDKTTGDVMVKNWLVNLYSNFHHIFATHLDG